MKLDSRGSGNFCLMRYLRTALFTATAVVAVGCGTAEQAPEPDMISESPVATLASGVLTLEQQTSEFWELREFGSLRTAPEIIHGTSQQLDDATLVTEWTDYLGGTTLVDQFSFKPFKTFCSDGSVVDGESRNQVGSTNLTWRVETFEESRGEREQLAYGGNSVKVVVKERFNAVPTYLGAFQGNVVSAFTGWHKDESAASNNINFGSGFLWAVTESIDCE